MASQQVSQMAELSAGGVGFKRAIQSQEQTASTILSSVAQGPTYTPQGQVTDVQASGAGAKLRAKA